MVQKKMEEALIQQQSGVRVSPKCAGGCTSRIIGTLSESDFVDADLGEADFVHADLASRILKSVRNNVGLVVSVSVGLAVVVSAWYLSQTNGER